MAYATTSDVQAKIQTTTNMGFTIGASTEPSTTTVTAWIAQFEARINAYLTKCGYEMPATGSDDIVLLRGIVTEYVAAQVWEVAYAEIEEPEKVARWREQGKDALTEMKTCDFALVDQTFIKYKGIRQFYSRVTTDDDAT